MSEVLIASLIAWTMAAMGIQQDLSTPTLVRWTNLQFVANDAPFHTNGAYVRDGGVIVLRDTLDDDDLYTWSIFVHEYVHHIQFETGVHSDYPSCRQKQAYEIQYDYLEAHQHPRAPRIRSAFRIADRACLAESWREAHQRDPS